MDIMTYIWLVLAAALLVGEMLTAGFFLIVFGIGAIGAALVAGFGGSQLWQWLTFVVVSALTFAGTRRFADRVHKGSEDSNVGAERFEGMQVRVLKSVDNAASEGMVKVEGGEWRADSADGRVIEAGQLVEIIRVEGAHLIVRPVEEGAAPEAPGQPQG
jgi:membrane protein implicated in regulation of membrane protease activity